ncbi:hypothetical protein QBZ16_002087 [Prototheca wickerhamii]|uniref:50S ribosomal protein L18 n=1 Tax=Prototheca wickerhamii TaxID=3111 RepID=A0AAD9IP15_PROWI|nr:hypothetical protein QBZ16_002087 [Prototheca wickerhamii]
MDVVKFRPHQVKLFFSNKFVYGQIIRLVNGEHAVVAAASTIEKGLQEGLESKSDKAACVRVGQVLAERAQEKGITSASWPRKKGQRYHGKVAALLDSFQQSGVKLA